MSGDSGAKITVDADTRSVEASAQKVQHGFRGAAREAQGIGDQLEHVGKHLAGHVLGVRALVKLLEHAGEAMKEYQKSLAEASKTAGEGIVSRAESGGRLGLNATQTGALTAPGIHSRKESDAFLAQIAGQNTGRNRVAQKDVARAFNLFRSGVFESGEITEALREGRLDELEKQVGTRTDAAGPEFKEEAARRARINLLEDTTEDAKAGRGGKYRDADAEIAARDARNPVGGAATGVLKSIPVIGAAIDVADREATAQGADRRGFLSNVGDRLSSLASGDILGAMLGHMSKIADNTASKPTVPSGGTE